MSLLALGRAEAESRLKQFKNALTTAKRFGLTVADIASLINMTPRMVFRILDGSRAVEHNDLIQIQTVALTVLKLQIKALEDPKFDIRKVSA